MINNIKIVKEENGNTSFIKNPSGLIDAFLPPVAGIRVNNKSNPNDSIIEIFSITGQKYSFLVSSIEGQRELMLRGWVLHGILNRGARTLCDAELEHHGP